MVDEPPMAVTSSGMRRNTVAYAVFVYEDLFSVSRPHIGRGRFVAESGATLGKDAFRFSGVKWVETPLI
jgi:hypothetical protein